MLNIKTYSKGKITRSTFWSSLIVYVFGSLVFLYGFVNGLTSPSKTGIETALALLTVTGLIIPLFIFIVSLYIINCVDNLLTR